MTVIHEVPDINVSLEYSARRPETVKSLCQHDENHSTLQRRHRLHANNALAPRSVAQRSCSPTIDFTEEE
jgi:hypothetical protein